MSELIYKSSQLGIDTDVPEFGGFTDNELRTPDIRPKKQDIFGEDAQINLLDSAIHRSLYFAYGVGEIPHVHFPNAEQFQHYPFTKRDWNLTNPESERGRIQFMLTNYASRQFPVEFAGLFARVFQSDDTLRAWKDEQGCVQEMSTAVYERILQQMNRNKTADKRNYFNGKKGAYQSTPIFYSTNRDLGKVEKYIWGEALQQAARQFKQGNFENIDAFLSLYGRIKDPITPVDAVLEKQIKIFLQLYDETQKEIPPKMISLDNETILLSQLALESSFLALPAANRINSVIYGNHHELPYYYADIAQFPRGEFANPSRVISITDEFIEKTRYFGEPVITPITGSYFQEPGQQPKECILDGNNRATAKLFAEYLAFVGHNTTEAFNIRNLHAFIEKHGIDFEWERDIAMVLKTITPDHIHKLMQNTDAMNILAYSKIPVLLVQEPNFHTIAVRLSSKNEIVLLQPMHQAIYNRKRMAIPSKEQSHGRTAGNDIDMGLLPANQYNERLKSYEIIR